MRWAPLTLGLGLLTAQIQAEPLPLAALASPLEDAGSTARAVGMGSAFVSVASDSSALLWNPGGLAQVSGFEGAIHHNSWIGGSLQEIATLAYGTDGAGTFGLSASYLDFGSFDGRDATGAKTAAYGASRLGMGLGWGTSIAKGFSAGLAVKGQSQTIAGESLSGFSGDLGLRWSPLKALDLGLAYAGLGSGPGGATQASSLRLGLSGTLGLGASSSLLLAVGGAMQPEGVNRVQLGAEATLYSVLVLRGGYQLGLADTKIEGLQGLALGLGFQWAGYRLDYGWQPFGELGSSQRLSLAFGLGPQPTKGVGTARAKKPMNLDQAMALERQGKQPEAMRAFSALLKSDPKNSTAWKHLGQGYVKIGRKDYAVHCFKQALQLDPGDAEAQALLQAVGTP